MSLTDLLGQGDAVGLSPPHAADERLLDHLSLTSSISSLLADQQQQEISQ